MAFPLFRVIQDALFIDVILNICRLLDPPESFGNKNMCLERLEMEIIKMGGHDELVNTLSDNKLKLRAESQPLRNWRNKKISHNDLKIARQENQLLSGITKKLIDDLLEQIEKYINEISLYFLKSQNIFNRPFLATVGDGERLLFLLEKAKEYLQQEKLT